VEAHVVMTLIGEGGALGPVIGQDGLVAVVHLARGHDLVPGMAVEGGQARGPVVVDL
jgi:hypothetical protein